MTVEINQKRLHILLAEMHSVLPDGYRVGFIARNVNNPAAHVVLTDMSSADIKRTLDELNVR